MTLYSVYESGIHGNTTLTTFSNKDNADYLAEYLNEKYGTGNMFCGWDVGETVVPDALSGFVAANAENFDIDVWIKKQEEKGNL